MSESDKPMVPMAEAQARLGMTRRQLDYLRLRGRIRHRRIGGRVVFHPADVEYLEQASWDGRAPWQEVGE